MMMIYRQTQHRWMRVIRLLDEFGQYNEGNLPCQRMRAE